MRELVIFMTLGFAFTKPSVSQTAATDSSELTLLPVSAYYNTLGEQSPLYNGSEYVDYSSILFQSHPFFNSTEFTKANIEFDGMLFKDVLTLYDIVKDKVIIQHYNQVFRIDLPVKHIRQFTLLDHQFIRLFPDSAGLIEEGFYDRLYKGKIELYAKRRKVIREERMGYEIHNVIDEKDLFFIYKDGRYYPVVNEGAMMKILKSKKDQIRQQLKKNNVKFRKQREKALLLAVEYYDRSSN